jgi:hypothetical protein
MTVIEVDPVDCGMGEGERTCAYLTMDMAGFRCGRETPARSYIDERLAAGTMKATAAPQSPFPLCQTERRHMR